MLSGECSCFQCALMCNERLGRLKNWLLYMNEMRIEQQKCDGILRTEDGGHVFVHRAVIATCSDYFRQLYTTPLHNPESRMDITIPGISEKILNAIVDYAYTHRTLADWHNVEDLLAAAAQFNIVGMVNDCCRFLMDQLTPASCIGILQFAKAHFCLELEEEAYNYLLYKIEDVLECSDEMSLLSLEELISLCSDDRLNVKSEKIVWDVIMKWASCGPSPQVNPEDVPKLLSCVRMIECDGNVVDTVLHPCLFWTKICDKYYELRARVFFDQMVTSERKLHIPSIYDSEAESVGWTQWEAVVSPAITLPRIPHDVLFVFGGCSTRDGYPSAFVQTYDIRANKWKTLLQLRDPGGPRAFHRVVSLGTIIYVIGGFDGMQYHNDCHSFDVVTKEWREIAPMHVRRCYLSAAVCGKYIYAIGGHDGVVQQDTAERYDPSTNQWIMIAPMHVRRSHASAASLNGKVYVAGGFSGLRRINTSAEMYDPILNVWYRIKSLYYPRSGLAVVACGEYIYALGGFNGTHRMKTVERYSPELNSWTVCPKMHCARSNFDAQVMEECIFVMGGCNGQVTLAGVECFDTSQYLWKEKCDMANPRSAFGACVIHALRNSFEYLATASGDYEVQIHTLRNLSSSSGGPSSHAADDQNSAGNRDRRTRSSSRSRLKGHSEGDTAEATGKADEDSMESHDDDADDSSVVLRFVRETNRTRSLRYQFPPQYSSSKQFTSSC